MEELIELLEKFQQAYTERDFGAAEAFISDVFVEREPVYYGRPSSAWARRASCASWATTGRPGAS